MPEETHNSKNLPKNTESASTSSRNDNMEDPGQAKIGVYTCYCGGNISDIIDCERVAAVLRKVPQVGVSRTHMSMCSDAGQAMIEADIRENGINRVVIGACAPSLHEQTFRGTVSRAGLNPYLYHHVGVREQDSWVHKHDHEQATEKAIRLMRAGIAKARLLEPLDSVRLSAEQHALVIGGGIAGLRSALDIARRGIRVTLLEKSPFLGGRMAQLENVFPCNNPAREALHGLIEEVMAHPMITILTRATLTGVSGYVGDFQVQVQQHARGITDQIQDIDAAIAACPVEVPDEFNYGLTTRKAIYRAYPGCYPATPAIDWDNCTHCGECLKVGLEGIDLEDRIQIHEIKVGAIVVATGFDLYEPQHGEYGYGELPEVMSLAKFIRLMAMNEKDVELRWNDRPVKNIALIHCVGSRQIEGVHEPQPDGQVNAHCSRVCCTATLHIANELHERYPDINLFEIYTDIRTYGRGHEDYYIRASADGVRFMRYYLEEMPVVEPAPEGDIAPVLVKVKDYLTWGQELEVPVDLVILATGMLPRKIDDLVRLLKISTGSDRFLAEVHPKLRPVETAVPGVILAGTAQGPMNLQESAAAASAAAAKVACLLGEGQVELEPFVAKVNPEKCNGTGACVEVCAYEDAIALQEFSENGTTFRRAVVTPANCSGCGACVSACPNGAIDVQGWTLEQYVDMVAALVEDFVPLESVR